MEALTLDRDRQQAEIYRWVRETFGEKNAEPFERARRFFEEAAELAQAAGLSLETVRAVVEYVYKKEPGTPEQEMGGVGLTLLAYAESRGSSAEAEEAREFERVLEKDAEYFRERHNKKATGGIAERWDK